jgi:hypothetical protein
MLEEFEEQVKISDGSAVPRQRFHFVRADKLLSEPKPIKWLIKDRLEAGSLSLIFGEPESTKTFVALDEGLCISSEKYWHGHKIISKGPVFYIAGEGFNGITRRIRAWEIYHGISLKDVPFFVSDRAAQFLDQDSANDVVVAVDEMRKIYGDPVLVIIDTLNRNFGPGDENSTKDMTSFIAIIDEKLRMRYGCAVRILHHSGLSTADRARGATALKAALDWEYKLKSNSDGTRTMTATKCKDFEKPEPISFRIEPVTLSGWVDPDTGEELKSIVLIQTDKTRHHADKPLKGAKKIAFDSLLQVIKDSGSAAIPESGSSPVVHIDVWRLVAYQAGISRGGSTAKRVAFNRALTHFSDNDIVGSKDDYYWPKEVATSYIEA